MKRIDIIDSLKGYSIFTIVIYHYLQCLKLPFPYNKVIAFGGTGVHLFVVLSGFGLYYSHLNKPLKYVSFIEKRFIKIYFPYLFVVFVTAFITLIIPIYNGSLYALGGHVFLYKMVDESIIGSYGYPLWFISMILQFYFAFYGIVWMKSKLKDEWFLVVGLLISIGWSVLVSAIGKEDERIWNGFFLQYYWEFALGMLVGERVYRGGKLPDKAVNRWLLLLVASISYLLSLLLYAKGGAVGKLFNDHFAFTGYTSLALWLFSLKISSVNRLFLFVGTISLPIYLLHTLVQLVISATVDTVPLVQIILSFCIVIPLAVLFQKGIDVFFKNIYTHKTHHGELISPIPAQQVEIRLEEKHSQKSYVLQK